MNLRTLILLLAATGLFHRAQADDFVPDKPHRLSLEVTQYQTNPFRVEIADQVEEVEVRSGIDYAQVLNSIPVFGAIRETTAIEDSVGYEGPARALIGDRVISINERLPTELIGIPDTLILRGIDATGIFVEVPQRDEEGQPTEDREIIFRQVDLRPRATEKQSEYSPVYKENVE